MLIYADFFRRFGVRKVEHLQNPVFTKLDRLMLPRESVYIYQPSSEVEDGPGLDDLYLKRVTRPVMMAHIIKLSALNGNPRPNNAMIENVIRKYHIQNKKYRRSRGFEQAVRDPLVPYVVNMALMQRRYKYIRNIYTEYNKWYNGFHTTLTTIAKLCTQTDRNIFLEMTLPARLPDIGTLRMMESTGSNVISPEELSTKEALGMEDYLSGQSFGLSDNTFYRIATENHEVLFENKSAVIKFENDTLAVGMEALGASLIRRVPGPQGFMVAELWKWLGKNRHDSMITLLTGHYDKINLIFRNGMYWTVLNLGVLDSWRKTPNGEHLAIPMWLEDEDLPIPDPEPKYVPIIQKGLDPRDIQIRLMKFFIRVFELGTVATHPEEIAQDATDLVQDLHERVETGHVSVDSTDGTTTTTVVNQISLKDQQQDSAEDVEKKGLDEESIEAELKKLTEMTASVTAQKLDVVMEESAIKTPEQGVIAVLDRLADEGSLSAAEYKRYQALAESYKKIKVTDYNGAEVSLAEYITIPKELTVINQTPMIKDINTVPDKSMLKSSLLTFDEHYVTKVLHRDVAGMVVNLQKAGIAVTDYNVERVEDVTGSYDDVVIRLNPVIGTPSTVRFRLPAVQEDGTYRANGVKYRIRKQRGD